MARKKSMKVTDNQIQAITLGGAILALATGGIVIAGLIVAGNAVYAWMKK